MSSWTVHVARRLDRRCQRAISGRLLSPTCSAGMRSPPPKRRGECRRTKLSWSLRHLQVRGWRRFKRSIDAVFGRTEFSERSRVCSTFHSSPVSRRARVCGMWPRAQRFFDLHTDAREIERPLQSGQIVLQLVRARADVRRAARAQPADRSLPDAAARLKQSWRATQCRRAWETALESHAR